MSSHVVAASAVEVLEASLAVTGPAMRAALETLTDERMRLICHYQMGWVAADGSPATAGGKALRPALALAAARAVGAPAQAGVAAGVAVELVHNFSLMHDDVMDGDVERRHRPTAWKAFGMGPAILAGSAMLTVAFEVMISAGEAGQRALGCLTEAVQALITGQSQDLAYEDDPSIDLQACLEMEGGKTAALIAASTAMGALCAGAEDEAVAALHSFGFELGLAFQIVDDILGIVGDPAVTGKSSSDVRAGKRSAPVVAALTSGTDAGSELGRLLAAGAPQSDSEVACAVALIEAAGGLSWARSEAPLRLASALGHLRSSKLSSQGVDELELLARYVVERTY